jgi:protein-S-isoprenylcysteine O-methyltransferase Ste14
MSGQRITPFLIVQCGILIVVTGVIIFRPGEWTIWRWTAAVIAFPSIVLFVAARYQLGRSFSVTAQARELVTSGIYSRIRNPIYVFSGLILLAFLLSFGRPEFLLILVPLIAIQIKRAHNEAKVLEEKFGDQYRDYRKKTWF